MLISALCPTYGRAPGSLHLLGEAVESFLRQTWRGAELIILNDCPGQVLRCDAPGVRVVNAPERFPTLGEKYDAMVRLARGDALLPWEDDDVSLPGRIAQAASRLDGFGYFNPQRTWYWHDGLHADHAHGVCHNASAYTRRAWEAAGGYGPHSGDQDARFDEALRRVARVAPPLGPSGEWTYVYRWGVSDSHLSGNADHAAFYAAVGRREHARGEWRIVPAWSRGWDSECQRAG